MLFALNTLYEKLTVFQGLLLSFSSTQSHTKVLIVHNSGIISVGAFAILAGLPDIIQ